MAQARSRVARLLLLLGGLALLGGGAALAGAYWAFLRDLPDLHSLEDYEPRLTTRVYDRQGRPIGEFYEERRRLVALEDVPRHVQRAFVAAEDASFYEHEGLDYGAILRAAWVNLRAGGEIRQGGSTITQQVAKSLLLSPERRFARKVKDMLLARRIEDRLSKDEILYLYLNQIYFGDGAYGLAEAARSYFGVTPAGLDVSQAALLAGLPKAPSAYSPRNDPAAAERRRRYVLERMWKEGYLDEASYEEALASPPALADELPEREAFDTAAYFVEEVRRTLVEALGSDRVLRGGLRIETTLDLEAQRAAVRSLRQGLRDLDRRQGWKGPVRHVKPAALDAEIARLADENGLDPDGLDPKGLEQAGLAEEDLEAPLLGVVTAVEADADRARVVFAPGLEGIVRLEDVAWARERDPSRWRPSISSIDEVFRVGDVARFALASADPGEAGADAEASEPGGRTEGQAPLRVVLHQEPEVEGALLSLDVSGGEVRALVGGYDFDRSEFDRAVQARRQPGSAFKPLVYAAALAHGWTPTSIVVDRPLVYEDPESGFTWRPGNYEGRFHGRLTLRHALAHSVNNATIHLLKEVGVGRALRFARRLGIESPLERNLSLALGSSGVTLLELVRAYAVFPAQGRPVEPVFVERVLDRDGRVLIEDLVLGEPPPTLAADGAAGVPAAGDPASGRDEASEAGTASSEAGLDAASIPDPDDPFAPPPGRVLSPIHAYLATSLLEAVVQDGTGRKAKALGRPLAGKTGTTNEQGDAWFVGFSPDVATGVWVGFDERRPLGRSETGGRAALPIWIDYMGAVLEDRPRRDFSTPDGVVFVRVDAETGLLAGPESEDPYFQAFAAGTEPTEVADQALANSESDRLLRLDAF